MRADATQRGPLSVRKTVRRAGIGLAVAGGLLASSLVPVSSGDLQSQINAGRSTASSLQSQISSETSQIRQTTGGLQAAEAHLSQLQGQLNQRIAELREVQTELLDARTRLVALENRLEVASETLANNLRAQYENGTPNLMTVILNSHGFTNLLDQVDFVQRISKEDAQIVGNTRAARTQVFREANRLGSLEERDRTLTDDVLSQRNQVAAVQEALLNQQIQEEQSRTGTRAKLAAVDARVGALQSKLDAIEARAAEEARQTGLQVNQSVGGIAIDTGGMVQPPADAPPAVKEMIAAGNAIATLPYIWGGGPRPVGDDLRDRRARLDDDRRLALRHGRAGRGRNALVTGRRRVRRLRRAPPARPVTTFAQERAAAARIAADLPFRSYSVTFSPS
jgi:peptidoglycan hydrolase CwlO-like protein